jgi:hypothetical protein
VRRVEVHLAMLPMNAVHITITITITITTTTITTGTSG